ncbi:tyrosine-type recombinase/integrase [Pararhodospirillum photometricum]|uniref:Integrase n=1 Tax=Pararhodospirillum photometricum DSM 122 TaxID=1150469 RepID=H6SM12_PARPM|nr:tyrosine-type recombinase/integrase [Pararhodospirillum photometricum]CCG09027.1 Integrase [Pararhodospirillum photometricum DSM 122]
MSPVDLPYLIVYRSGNKRYAYYRRSGKRVRVTAPDGAALLPGDGGFIDAYQRIHASFEVAPHPAFGRGSLAHLIEDYKKSPEFKEKSEKTRKDYSTYLELLKVSYGNLPVKTMPRDFIFALRDKYASTPRKANYIIQMLRILFNYALDRPTTYGVTVNVAARPKGLKEGPGHKPWEEAQIDAFRATWPAGTWERVAFELCLNTGQRGGDVLAMERGQVVGGVIKVHQKKTGAMVEVKISTALGDVLGPWLAGLEGDRILGSMLADGFRHRMSRAFKTAGLKGVTTHGLRYTAATRLREVGMDWEDIAAITGHQTAEMTRKYSAQKKRASKAIDRLDESMAKPRKTPSV